MNNNIATRMNNIAPFHVMKVLQRAQELEKNGRDIVHMEVGEPDFNTPEPIIEAANKALQDGLTKYTPAAGIEELREAIAGFYQQRYGVKVSPQRIIITPGATGGLQLVLAALLDIGDEVLLPDPGYPCNRHYVELFNGKPVALNVDASNNYQPTAQAIDANWSERTRALLLASPANPTGAVLSKEQIQDYQSLIKSQIQTDRNAVLIVDEIYHGLSYGEELAATALSLPETEQLFVINSFSKYFGMTGWRLGWIVAPEQYLEPLNRLAQNMFLCAPTVSQYAALAAFSADSIHIMEQRRNAFKGRRDYLLPALKSLGFEIPTKPEGAFYLYANCENLASDSSQLASDILEKAGVAVTPGLDFGKNQPEAFIRFAYTTNIERMKYAIDQIKAYL